MMKKFVACILSLALVLSSGAVAFGAETVNEESVAVSADFQFAKAVGIFSEDVVPDSTVKRMELAECILNIILQGTELETDNGSLLFDDVEYSMSGYSDAIANAGIMGGTGYRQFSPEANVTYSQLLKVFVSFLGYDVKAQSLGGYPSGYMAVATQLGITDKFAPYGDSYVTWETLASMFKRALGVPLFQVVYYKDSTFIYTPNSNKDYLYEYFGIKRYSDVINGVYNVNVLGCADVSYDEIILGGTTFRFDTDFIDLSTKLGRRIEAFYVDEGTTGNILYYDEYGNDVILLDGREVEGYDNGILYYNGKKEKRIKINGETNIVYNNRLCTSGSMDIFNVWNLSTKDGTLEAVDNNSDGIYDFINIDAYDSYVVGTITDDIIIPLYRESAYVDISSYREGENALFFNLEGKPVSKGKVVKGCVISVSQDLDGNTTSIVVTTDSYTGEIEEIEVENGKYYITVNGVRYTPSESLAFNPQIESLRVGQKVTMMFNKSGYLSDVEALQFQAFEIAYLTDAKKGKGIESADDVSVRVFSSTGIFRNYDFAKKVEVLHGTDTTIEKPVNVLAYLGTEENGDVKRQVIRFKKNENGEISWINIAKDGVTSVDGLYRYDTDALGLSKNSSGNLLHYGNSFDGKLLISGTAVFGVPSEELRDDEDLYIIGKLDNNYFPVVEVYGNEKGSRVATALIIDNSSAASFANSLGIMVVDSVRYAMDSNLEPSVKVTGYISGTLSEYFGDENILKIAKGALPENGDIIRFRVDREGRITSPQMIFDKSEKQMYIGGAPTTDNPTASFSSLTRYLYGSVVWTNDASFMVTIGEGLNERTDAYMKAASYKYYLCEDVGTKGSILRTAKPEDIIAYPQGAGEETHVFMATSYGVPSTIVIYR